MKYYCSKSHKDLKNPNIPSVGKCWEWLNCPRCSLRITDNGNQPVFSSPSWRKSCCEMLERTVKILVLVPATPALVLCQHLCFCAGWVQARATAHADMRMTSSRSSKSKFSNFLSLAPCPNNIPGNQLQLPILLILITQYSGKWLVTFCIHSVGFAGRGFPQSKGSTP